MHATATPPVIGISSCLLGQAVRYDGQHKFNKTVDRLGRRVLFARVCPEVAIGMGVPRPPIQLRGCSESPRAVGVDDPQRDPSAALIALGRENAGKLALSGYIFKAHSPSCGIGSVPVYSEDGGITGRAHGLYANEFLRAHPLLPVIDEKNLARNRLQYRFMLRVYGYQQWQALRAKPLARNLKRFHSGWRALIDNRACRTRLDRLAAASRAANVQQTTDRYFFLLLTALKRHPMIEDSPIIDCRFQRR